MAIGTRAVFKFGGAALADGAGVQRAVSIIQDRLADSPVVVVSAHSGVTRLLEEAAASAASGSTGEAGIRIRHRSLCAQLGLDSERLNRFWIELSELLAGVAKRGVLTSRDRDAILSIGERVSARIVAMSLRAAGVLATPVDAFDLGLVTQEATGQAEPRADSQSFVRSALAEIPGVPVVTGFLARCESGFLTTLGPNGSDWTAAWIAEAIGASELVFWKTVSGFMTSDPSLVPSAQVIEQLSWEDAFELARHGAAVLHPRAIEPARRSRVHVTIRDVTNLAASGTRLVEAEQALGATGISAQRETEDAMRIAVIGAESSLQRAAQCLREHGIEFRPHGSEPKCFVVSKADLLRALMALHAELFEERASVRVADCEA